MSSSTLERKFSSRLRSARQHRGLTQAELAAATGLEQSAVSHFESGRRTASIENLRRLAEALDVTSDFLIGLDDTIRSQPATTEPLLEVYHQLSASDAELLLVIAQEIMKRRRR